MASTSRGDSASALHLSFRAVVVWIIFTSMTISTAVLFSRLCCLRAIFLSFVIAVTYVGSLYVWNYSDKSLTRNHEVIIKKRFVSVTFASILAPLILGLNRHLSADFEVNIFRVLGFSLNSSVQAIILPLFLTMILYSGSLFVSMLDGVCVLYIDRRFWKSNFQNCIWLRDNVMAPLTEEFNFRACMIPILVPCLGIKWSILCSPLFFGVAHFHHMMEKMEHGMPFKNALTSSMFQFSYTTLFGIYSSFLFIRTGNFLAPFVVHAFCNHMGFPNFSEVLAFKQPLRFILGLIYVLGVVAWYYLLMPLTDPNLYFNTIWMKF